MMTSVLYGSVLLVLLTCITSALGNNCLMPTGDSGELCTCCKSGYFGDDCTTICPNCERTLIMNGTKCIDGCGIGYYGEQCENECSTACRDNECFRDNATCYTCNNTRYYGHHCNVTCNSGCYNKTCEINGICIDGCNSGFYSPTCELECGHNCNNQRCNASRSDGYDCTDGCKDGFMLTNCTRRCPENCQKCHQHSSRCISCEHGFVAHCDNEEDCNNGSLSCQQVSTKTWMIGLIVLPVALVITMIIITVYILKKRRQDAQKWDEKESLALLPLDSQVSEEKTTFTRLHTACREGNLDVVTFLLNHQKEAINSRGEEGMTPVMEATKWGKRQVRDFLVEQDCDLTLERHDKDTVLHIACSINDMDFNIKGSSERTPLMVAAHKGHRKLFDLLKKEESIDLLTTDDGGDNILHIACITACKSKSNDFVKYLLRLDIFDINVKGNKERTPVLTAAESGSRELFDLLKSHNCDMEVKDNRGDNILNIACYKDANADFVKYLLTLESFDINLEGYKGRTPLLIAARNGCKKVFKLLKQNGADPMARDIRNETILGLACRDGDVEFVRYLVTLDLFDINTKGKKGRTPIMTAAKRGHRGVFDLLLDEGSDESLTDDNGDTCFTLASKSENVNFTIYVAETFPEYFESNLSSKEDCRCSSISCI